MHVFLFLVFFYGAIITVVTLVAVVISKFMNGCYSNCGHSNNTLRQYLLDKYEVDHPCHLVVLVPKQGEIYFTTKIMNSRPLEDDHLVYMDRNYVISEEFTDIIIHGNRYREMDIRNYCQWLIGNIANASGTSIEAVMIFLNARVNENGNIVNIIHSNKIN